MIAPVTVCGAAGLLGSACYGGMLFGAFLTRTRLPLADGPARIAYRRWPFAAIGAVIGIILALRGTAPLGFAFAVAVCGALAAGAAADLACGILPDVVTLVPLTLVLGAALVMHAWAPFAGAAAVALPFALLAGVSHGRGMGWGDVKLAALGGALLGMREAALAFMLASIAAYVVTRGRRADVRRPIAFGPYLAASIAMTVAVQGAL